VELIINCEYEQGNKADPVDALHELAETNNSYIVCRIRRSADNVLFVFPDTMMSRLCSYDEYVSELRFCEIDALMSLSGYKVLKLDSLLEQYRGTSRIILHFRNVRPNADIISRIMKNDRFSFATDSLEQLAIIMSGFPDHKAVGYACHLPTAEQMAGLGIDAVCMYGREAARFAKLDFTKIKNKCELWYEITQEPEAGLDAELQQAKTLGFDRIATPLRYIR
jgi:hypothetical protein